MKWNGVTFVLCLGIFAMGWLAGQAVESQQWLWAAFNVIAAVVLWAALVLPWYPNPDYVEEEDEL